MLDLLKCKRQINKMVAERQETSEDYHARLVRSLALIKEAAGNWRELQSKIVASRTTWLVAGLTEGLLGNITTSAAPRPLAVLAVDGSQIFPDRHEIASCYLLNLGLIALYYGTGERPLLSNEPHLYYSTEDLYPRIGNRQSSISPELVGLKRTVMEMQALADLASTAVLRGYPTIALSDGTLILWSLEGFHPDTRDELLQGFLCGLDALRDTSVPCAGFISQPGATDVVNALRVYTCPEAFCSCDRCPYASEEVVPCEWLSGLTDAVLFGRLLQPGEITPKYYSQSKILSEYGENRIAFRYLHVGPEVVRLEFPDWLTDEQQMLLASVSLDQANKGAGYPVALSEAHEQAVIRGADRQAFYQLLEDRMVEQGVRAQVSYKSLRKRGVFV